MRYLRPRATPIKIKDKTYNILFTLEVIDELQIRSELPITKTMKMITYESTRKIAITFLLSVLFPSEKIEIDDSELYYLYVMLMSAYSEQIFSKEMELRKTKSAKEEFVDIEKWIYIGTVVLGYPEKEVWNMTLGKIDTLYREHLKYIGIIAENKVVNIDDVI